MSKDMTPNPGPERNTKYVPGTPGGDWTEEEVAVTKRRIMKMITPSWREQYTLGFNQYPGRLNLCQIY